MVKKEIAPATIISAKAYYNSKKKKRFNPDAIIFFTSNNLRDYDFPHGR